MKVCIFGLGRIGLPIALVCADSDYTVVGIDINKRLIDCLKKAKTPFEEPGMEELLKKNLNKNFYPKHPNVENVTQDLKQADYIILAVGTRFAKYPDKPKLSKLYSIIGQIISAGIKGKTIILRVTLPIGTADEIKELIEKKTGMIEGKDFWFGFVPERIMEGKAIKEERALPKIVGCYSNLSFTKVSAFFKKIGGEIIKTSNPKTAEFIKLVDNSWRNTRFAFANELAFLAENNDIDIMEAIESANAGYERNEIPRPGPVSGYCLGKDPYFLENAFKEIAEKRGFNSVWYYGRRANDWFYDKVANNLEGKNILVAGLSFKENIDDFRYSHGLEITRILLAKGYKVIVCDPFLNKNYYTELPKDLEGKVKSYTTIEKALECDIDTILFTTRHREYRNLDLEKLIKNRKKSSPIKIIDICYMFPSIKK
ncbi:MAG: nucleotide sugar dehydrogenase [Thermoplasmatales archaeon]|nr:MAG: nucleotide sugar dehydrogenase [Thermoplasmatales archaeon]